MAAASVAGDKHRVSEDCTSLWNKFFSAFSFMPPCAVSMNHYDAFMQAAQQKIPRDKAMFWSGVKDLAHEYAADGQRYVTLEDTLIGYLVDGLIWLLLLPSQQRASRDANIEESAS
nr:hypothetical protein BaRGS_003930 [Batillaria attramentaria]